MILVILGLLTWFFGLLLCFTIILAPVGWILMFIGGIMTLVGVFGRRRTVITNVVQVSNAPGMGMQANVPLGFDDRQPMRTIEPRFDAREPRLLEGAPVVDVTPREPLRRSNGFTYDQAKWNALTQYDPDIARLVKVLSPYGQKYVDELAAAYLALNADDAAAAAGSRWRAFTQSQRRINATSAMQKHAEDDAGDDGSSRGECQRRWCNRYLVEPGQILRYETQHGFQQDHGQDHAQSSAAERGTPDSATPPTALGS